MSYENITETTANIDWTAKKVLFNFIVSRHKASASKG